MVASSHWQPRLGIHPALPHRQQQQGALFHLSLPLRHPRRHRDLLHAAPDFQRPRRRAHRLQPSPVQNASLPLLLVRRGSQVRLADARGHPRGRRDGVSWQRGDCHACPRHTQADAQLNLTHHPGATILASWPAAISHDSDGLKCTLPGRSLPHRRGARRASDVRARHLILRASRNTLERTPRKLPPYHFSSLSLLVYLVCQFWFEHHRCGAVANFRARPPHCCSAFVDGPSMQQEFPGSAPGPSSASGQSDSKSSTSSKPVKKCVRGLFSRTSCSADTSVIRPRVSTACYACRRKRAKCDGASSQRLLAPVCS